MTASGSANNSRRRFLQQASAATAGAWLMSKAQGQEQPSEQPVQETPSEPEKSPIRLAILGTGGMGSAHMRTFLSFANDQRENVELVALCDVCQPRLEAAHQQAKEAQPDLEIRTYRDHREMLAQEQDLQAVCIASPEHWHADHAIDCIRAGLDVYLEKPMTLTLSDAMKLWRVQRNSDRIVVVGTQYTTLPKYLEAKRLIAEGAIGHPVSSQTSYCRNSRDGEWLYSIDENVKPGSTLDWDAWLGALGPAPFDTHIFHRWRRYKNYSTGIVGDLLVHMMTPLVMALDVGWPVRVTATGGHYIDKAMENHDQVNLTIQFEKEHTMVVAGSTCNEQGLEPMIRGHKANLYLSGNNCKLVPERVFVDEIDEVDFQVKAEPPQDRLRLDFLDAVRTRQQPISTVELGTKIMVIVDLATRAMWEGGTFGYSPASMSSYRI